MNTEKIVDCLDSVLTISDDDDDASKIFVKCGERDNNVITIGDEVITISDDTITISDDEVIVISSDNSLIENEANNSDDSMNVASETVPSFDFESSAKMQLQQPRTSTPLIQRNAVESIIKARNRKLLLICSIFQFREKLKHVFVCFFLLYSFSTR